ncbi:unnamed protein product [Chironomus riparius]|uniref:Uncharacterized protein n=1 Tax=Chironomus riparius TaxID=315576 RepID=A0A9P0IWW4_9DIPT|nr:unnamed protein product [Chironomus riparius]
MVRVKTSSIPILLLLSVLVLSVAHGQLLTRRQQFNLLRQQQQLDGQENVSVRQSAIQDNKENTPVSFATFERIFDFKLQAIRTVNELLQALSAIRARLNSDSSQLASLSISDQ